MQPGFIKEQHYGYKHPNHAQCCMTKTAFLAGMAGGGLFDFMVANAG
jgi:hypothetical protein